MDFFEAQDNARRTSNWLIVVFIPVVAAIVASVTFIIVPAYFFVLVGIAQVASGEAGSVITGNLGYPREIFLFVALLTTLTIIVASTFMVYNRAPHPANPAISRVESECSCR